MRRLTAAVALVCSAVVLVAVLVGGGQTHILHLRFVDAGQLVPGDRVNVATQRIGQIKSLSLSADGEADLTVEIDHDWPLHLGTTAAIRLTSQVGIANRYIELTPGDVKAPVLKNNAVVSTDYTTGAVDVDETLDDFTPRVRKDLRTVLQGSETAIDGVVPEAQSAIDYGFPALAQSDETLAELTADTPALKRLLDAGGQVSSALARNTGALSDSVVRTASLFHAVAQERTALADVLERAPHVLPAVTSTLRRVRGSIDRSIRPTLKRLIPVAQPLADVLERLPQTAHLGVPALRRVRSLLPATRLGLQRMVALAKVAVPALRAAAASIAANQDEFSGLLQYAPEAIIGGATAFSSGLGYYDAVGHFIRFNLTTAEDDPVGPIDAALGGPTRSGFSSGNDAPCPGGATQPAPDKSNPRPEPASLCDPKDNVK